MDKHKTFRLLDHRMQSVSTLNWALGVRTQWKAAPSISVHVDGKLMLEGNLNAITNPMLDVGLVHCRALLEFLGLCDKAGSLSQIDRRQKSDVGIEDFSNAKGPLSKVTPEIAVSRCGGDQAKAEAALLKVFHLANKGLAHNTNGLIDDPADFDLIETASRSIPSLMVSYFYTPLGLPRPDPRITTHRR